MKFMLEGIRYDTNKMVPVCELIEENPKIRSRGTKVTTLFVDSKGHFFLSLVYSYKGKVFDLAVVRFEKSKAFEFVKRHGTFEQLELYFPQEL